jgi:valyl-tRNA synthetase
MVKPELYGDDEELRRAARSTLIHVFEVTLSLLHPFMPFVTEEIWQQLPCKKDVDSLCVRRYPRPDEGISDKEAEERIRFVMDAVTGIRSIRGELNLSPSLKLKALIKTVDGTKEVLSENMAYITKLARAENIEIGIDIKAPRNSATAIKPAMEIYVPLEGLVDIDAEIERLNKEKSKIEEALSSVRRKLSNEDFRRKAPREVVEENKARYNQMIEKIQAIQENIEKLKQWRKGDE